LRTILDTLNFRSPALRRRLADRFNSLAVAGERPAMGYDSPPWDVLRSFDVNLDGFPHNAGATLFERLCLGAPFVTLAGRTSRRDHPDGDGHRQWIASREAEDIEKAAGLAADARRLAKIEPALRDEFRASPLMDEVGFARAVAAPCRAMRRRRLGLAASELTIAPQPPRRRQPPRPAGSDEGAQTRAGRRKKRSPHRLQIISPFGMRTAGWPVCLRHQPSFWPPQTHWPAQLRWKFGPQPPKANAGETVDETTAERMTTPNSLAESLLMKASN